jgi:iron-sulfur cluster assembly protein
MTIKVTELALKNIQRLQDEYSSKDFGLRFGLETVGCSGYKYVIEFEEFPLQDDKVYEIKNDNFKIDIYVSDEDLLKLNNSVIDWSDTLLSSGFNINNPQAKQPCGCGESVNF